MTLDEAIANEKKVVEESKSNIIIGNNLEPYESDCNEKCNHYTEEHEQFLAWLEELKQYRNIGTIEVLSDMMKEADSYRDVFNKTATISFVHILPETSELLETAYEEAFTISGVTVIKKDSFGYYLYPAEELFDETLPADLRECLDFAKAHGCSCLCFDTDGEILPELSDYSEEWSKPRPERISM